MTSSTVWVVPARTGGIPMPNMTYFGPEEEEEEEEEEEVYCVCEQLRGKWRASGLGLSVRVASLLSVPKTGARLGSSYLGGLWASVACTAGMRDSPVRRVMGRWGNGD